jgi:hypothetical protein
MDQDEISNLYRGPSIDVSYQISDQLALRFQRRRLKCEKLNRRRTPSDDKSSHCLWQGELIKSSQNTLDRNTPHWWCKEYEKLTCWVKVTTIKDWHK